MKKIKRTEINARTPISARPAFVDKCFTKKNRRSCTGKYKGYGYTTGQVLAILEIPKHKLYYLFESRKLLASDILHETNGRRVYTEKMLEKIRGLLK